jgi:type II secretory ATPase GspE/PulE/Tfp pilus assembly ATPase PilB-like protein
VSDLSQPVQALLHNQQLPPHAQQAADHPASEPFAWPTPDLAGYPAAMPAPVPPACELEGLNGKLLEGQLLLFAPERGVLLLGMQGPRKPLPLRLEQLRRLRLLEPLRANVGVDHNDASDTAWADDLVATRPVVPFRIDFKNAPVWQGHTVGHQVHPWGVFLFQPVDDQGTLQRWFVPRAAYHHAEVGLRLGEALIAHDSATPDQIRLALAEQNNLRNQKLGDMLVVRQIITADELEGAIEQQARMPMVRIGEALRAMGYISDAQLDDALVQQRADRGVPLGELLVRKGLVSRADLQTALARKLGCPLVDVLEFPADSAALARLPYAVAARIPALPLMRRNGRLVVAVEDPSNRSKLDEIEFAAQCKVVAVLARAGTLQGAVDQAYERMGAITASQNANADLPVGAEYDGDAGRLLATMEKVEASIEEDDDPGIEQSDNSLVRLINSMILEAHKQGVSDIHIECPAGKEKVRIRFRRDGQLRPYLELPANYRNALIARIKIMCDLDISEKRKPQDGKINFSKFVQGVKLELRVATIPTNAGVEDAVMRLLQSSKPIPLENLGLAPANLARFKVAIQRPYGMLLCVGPTGSGKTTTLHSAMGFINTPERKIWTAEDPVEITQAGLRQVQVNPRIEWTFAKALRAFLRADPDVIMVGEIRDAETANVSVEASLTGHLVLSTLHTNSAPETVTRLLDMGIDPFNFADALLGVLAQRLVRKLCTQCRQPHLATAEEEEELLQDYLHVMQGVVPAADQDGPIPNANEVLADWRRRFGAPAEDGRPGRLTLYKPVGCKNCSDTGYRGRAGIHELMMVTRGLRHLIQTGGRADQLQRHALADGMRTLRQDGIEKVLAGVTTIEEVRASS